MIKYIKRQYWNTPITGWRTGFFIMAVYVFGTITVVMIGMKPKIQQEDQELSQLSRRVDSLEVALKQHIDKGCEFKSNNYPIILPPNFGQKECHHFYTYHSADQHHRLILKCSHCGKPLRQ